MAEERHSGITMHKLSFGGGFIGLLFAAGSVLIFVLGFPTLWYFVALAFACGIAVAILLRVGSDWRSGRNRPLSIMMADDKSPHRAAPNAAQEHQLRQAQPRFLPA